MAGTNEKEIRIECGTSEIGFTFSITNHTLDEFVSAFYTPEPSSNRSLRHLLTGLWSVRVKKHAVFELTLAGHTETLIWDGYRMHRVASPVTFDSNSITVAPKGAAPKVSVSLTAMFLLSSSNAKFDDLLNRLADTCYGCPLPLFLDGCRVDSLLLAEFHGASQSAFPLTIGFLDPPLPGLRLPLGMFEDKDTLARKMGDGEGWGSYSADRFRRLLPRSSAGMAFSLCVKMRRVRRSKSDYWKACQGRSTVYWILDGALVGHEDLLTTSTHCSRGCLVSADGLPIDAQSLMWVRSPEKRGPLRVVRRAALEAAESLDLHTFDDLVAFGRPTQLKVGAAMMAASVFHMSLDLLGGSAAGGDA